MFEVASQSVNLACEVSQELFKLAILDVFIQRLRWNDDTFTGEGHSQWRTLSYSYVQGQHSRIWSHQGTRGNLVKVIETQTMLVTLGILLFSLCMLLYVYSVLLCVYVCSVLYVYPCVWTVYQFVCVPCTLVSVLEPTLSFSALVYNYSTIKLLLVRSCYAYKERKHKAQLSTENFFDFCGCFIWYR